MINIDKNTFERHVYVATSAHMEVFDSVEPSIYESGLRCERDILGDIGLTAMKQGGELEYQAKRLVCLDAILLVFRQLDLVLTPTGFGVVQNQNVSPASKTRVDALHAQLLYQRERALCLLLRALCGVNGWGESAQAVENIRYVYDLCSFERAALEPVDMPVWRKAQQHIMEAGLLVRRKISDKQMDTILCRLRMGETDAVFCRAVNLIRDITTLTIYGTPAREERIRKLLALVESEPETFKEYFESEEYKANHHESFRNTKDSPAYFFG